MKTSHKSKTLRKLGIVLSTIASLMMLALVFSTSYGSWPSTVNGIFMCLYFILSVAITGMLLMAKYQICEHQGSPTGR